MTKLLMIAFLLATLTGCFPYITHYVHLEASGATNTGACTGPPVFANYEAKGALFAVTLGPSLFAGSSAGYMRVIAPQNMAVSMQETFGHITPERGSDSIRIETRSV